MLGDLLVELVRRYSPSTHEREAVDYLVGWMSEHNFRAYRDEVGNAVGIRGRENALHTLMLLGHIDTYPGEIPVRIEDGCLYGRGSVDAKGSLCAFADAAAVATVPDGWRVVVIGALEEENITSKGAVYARECFSPTMCVIGEPSGADRITLGYKGRLVLQYALSRPVAHTALPTPSIGELGAAFWQKIVDWAEGFNRGINSHFDRVLPHLRSINTETDFFHDTVRLTVSLRLPPALPPDAAFAAVQPFAEPDATLNSTGPEYAYRSDRNNALVRGMLAAIRLNGGQPGFVLKTGTSDMNIVGQKWTCPIVAYGPGDSSLDHTPNEHLPFAEYEQAVRVLKTLIEYLPSVT